VASDALSGSISGDGPMISTFSIALNFSNKYLVIFFSYSFI